MIVESIQDHQSEQWDAYVTGHPNQTFYHQWAWKRLVEQVHGHRGLYHVAREGEKVVGVLPMFYIKGPIGGVKLIATPAAVVGGILADSPQAEALLIETAVSYAKSMNVDYLVLRQGVPLDSELLVTDSRFANVHVPLMDPEVHFPQLRTDIRRCLRRALEKDFEYELQSRDIDTFYDYYARGMRALGTPVEGARWIKTLFHAFPDNHFVAMVRHQGTVVLVKLMRVYGNQIMPVLSYGHPDYKGWYPEHALTWKMMEWGYQQGKKIYNFGRSLKDSGAYKFKMGWIGEEAPLYYQYYLHQAKSMPDHAQTSERRQSVAAIWRRMPLFLTNWIGPRIRKWYV